MSGGAPAMPSGALRRWVWVSRAVVSPAERTVLLALADYADEHGRGARPSIETLCGRLGMWPSAVRRRLDALVRSGHLARRVVSRRAPTVYDLLLDCPVWPERAPEVPSERAPEVPSERAPEIRERAPEVPSERAPEVTRSSHRSSPEPVSRAGAGEELDLPLGQGWHDEEQSTGEKVVPQEPNGPSQHAFYRNGQPSAETTPSIPAGRTSESTTPVVSDVERALAYYAEVAPLNLRRALRGPTPARGRVEAAVAEHGVDAVVAAIDAASTARADGCPPWDWVMERLNGKTRPAGGRRNGYDPSKDPRVVGWSRGAK